MTRCQAPSVSGVLGPNCEPGDPKERYDGQTEDIEHEATCIRHTHYSMVRDMLCFWPVVFTILNRRSVNIFCGGHAGLETAAGMNIHATARDKVASEVRPMLLSGIRPLTSYGIVLCAMAGQRRPIMEPLRYRTSCRSDRCLSIHVRSLPPLPGKLDLT